MIGQALGTIGSILGVFGKEQMRKSTPQWQKMDLSSQVSEANKINTGQLAASEKLATEANVFNQDQLTQMLNKAIPGYSAMQKQQGDVIGSMLKGELPQDVLDQIGRESAAYGVASGTVGSQFSGYRGLRQLGINSLQYAQGGLAAADRWAKTSAQIGRAPMMDVTSMFVSPMQVAGWNLEQNKLGFESQLMKWGQGNFLTNASQSLMETGGMWSMGGMMGGMGGSQSPNVGVGMGNPQGAMWSNWYEGTNAPSSGQF